MVRPDPLAADPTVPEEAEVLRRFIEAIESGELMESTPQDVAVVRRLQGALGALGRSRAAQVRRHDPT